MKTETWGQECTLKFESSLYIYKRFRWKKMFVVLKANALYVYKRKNAALEETFRKMYIAESCAVLDHGFEVNTKNGKRIRLDSRDKLLNAIWVKLLQKVDLCTEVQYMDYYHKVKYFCILMDVVFKNSDNTKKVYEILDVLNQDIVFAIDIPARRKKCLKYYGREGFIQFIQELGKIVLVHEFSLSNIAPTDNKQILRAQMMCKLENRYSGKCTTGMVSMQFTWSAGGRITSLAFYMDVDPNVFMQGKQKIQKSTVWQKWTCKQKLDDSLMVWKGIDLQHDTLSKRTTCMSMKDFVVHEEIGRGSFGKVVLATWQEEDALVAIKCIPKHNMTEYECKQTRTEMIILRDIEHPFISKLWFSFQNDKYYYLGMEYYPGGSLYAKITSEYGVKRISLPVDQVQFYATQIILAIAHLHQHHIVYRDLKPDNIVIDSVGYVVLLDFGLAKRNIPDGTNGAKTMAGSPGYTAPEILNPSEFRCYGTSIDWWCLGVLLYELLYGKRPFTHPNPAMLYRKIQRNNVEFPPVDHSSKHYAQQMQAQDLIEKLLTKQPHKRLGSGGVLEIQSHDFFDGIHWDLIEKRQLPAPSTPTCHESTRIQLDERFSQQHVLSKVVHRVIAKFVSRKSSASTVCSDQFSYVRDSGLFCDTNENRVLSA